MKHVTNSVNKKDRVSRKLSSAKFIVGLVLMTTLLAGTFSIMFGLLGQREPLAGLSALFVAVFEFSLGIYLITKGFKSNTLIKL